MERMPISNMSLTSHLILREKRGAKKKNIHMTGQMIRPSQTILNSLSELHFVSLKPAVADSQSAF